MDRRTFIGAAAGASLTSTTASAQSVETDGDASAVQGLLNEYEAAWAASDAERMFAFATDDIEWVNIMGMYWRGKAEVIATHHAILTTRYRGVPMTLVGVESLRSLGSEVLIAVVRWTVGGFTAPGGREIPETDDRMTMAFRRTSDGLRLAQVSNVEINAAAAAADPARQATPTT